MARYQSKPDGPDLAQGLALSELVDGGKLVGYVGDDQVLVMRVMQTSRSRKSRR